MKLYGACIFLLFIIGPGGAMLMAQNPAHPDSGIDISGFHDSAHHWYDIDDDDKMINGQPGQSRYNESQVAEIASNILLYQKDNGGWPKNYDMLAVLTGAQADTVTRARGEENTTFDNGTTHSQVAYLARAYRITHDDRFRLGALRGIEFILRAQYPNGGWPQFYPDPSGYRKYITFNDGAMIGVMNILRRIVENDSDFVFVDSGQGGRAADAFKRGLECILKCQVARNGKKLVWGQQHDNVDLRPQSARNFEPASLTGRESAEILLFLMAIQHPDRKIIEAVDGGVEWIKGSAIHGIRVNEIPAPLADFKYRKHVDFDRIVVKDSTAPPIWARMYDVDTNTPIFCNRDKKIVYSLAEVERERRVGYTWYTYAPQEVLEKYEGWRKGVGGGM
jgi:PelA/Pel-15E family pectate lyase